MIYEFIYKRESLKEDFKYEDFVRQVDRPISEQKQEVRQLIANGYDKFILNVIQSREGFKSNFLFNYSLVVEFETEDENAISIMNVGSFSNTND